MEENIIKIENASLKLGKFSIKPAIINIPKGYIVGIQGDNGAGKFLECMIKCRGIFT